MNKDKFFMNVAKIVAEQSKCNRSKVGAILVKEGNIIAIGYNGTPSGFCNDCEHEDVTLPEVLHAESNALVRNPEPIARHTPHDPLIKSFLCILKRIANG